MITSRSAASWPPSPVTSGGPSELVSDDFESRPAAFARAGELIGHLSTGGGPDGVVTITDREGHQIARTTASGGEYAVRGLEPGMYTAVATAPGFRPAVAAVTLNGVGVVRDFALDGNGVVTGSVTGPDGCGRAGALVIATDAGGTVVARAHTATDGSFRMAGLPVGPTTLAASVPEYEPDALTVDVDHAGTATADLVLRVVERRRHRHRDRSGRPPARAGDGRRDRAERGRRGPRDHRRRRPLRAVRHPVRDVHGGRQRALSRRRRRSASRPGAPVQADLQLGDPVGDRAAH